MQLTEAECSRFYKIWDSLILFVNSRLSIVQGMSFPCDTMADLENVVIVRSALWADDSLLDKFAMENPNDLSNADLELSMTWKNRVGGLFIVERHLKKGSIFIDENDNVYSVAGLFTAVPDLIPDVPSYLETFLIPFENRIIWDGLVNLRPIRFGSNIRKRFRGLYVSAKSNNEIITSLTGKAVATAR